jgi:hypothetical protein
MATIAIVATRGNDRDNAGNPRCWGLQIYSRTLASAVSLLEAINPFPSRAPDPHEKRHMYERTAVA